MLRRNNESTKSKMRSKSTARKPLRDVSNNPTNSIKSVGIYKNTPNQEIADNNNAQDFLLLAHSDISSVLSQIDELVVQALQATSNKGRKEIKQFADVLSEMHTSLKPWVSRIQKALSDPSKQTEVKSEQPKEEKSRVYVLEEDIDLAIESPEKTKWESLISPSPLVSWRAESKTERGRQLFLLTPLHKTRPFSAKRQVSAAPANEKFTSDETLQPVTTLNENLLGDVSTTNSALNNAFNSQITKTITDFENEYVSSPAKFSNCSKLVMMTPSLKFSPPKSCAVLEPVSEFAKKKNPLMHKSTPFPTRTQNSGDSSDSESSSHETYDDFKTKYPDLFGIKLGNVMGNRVKVLDESPGWDISPPITCTILEPSTDEITLSNPPADLSLVKTTDLQQGIVESTPMVKEPASSFRVGKQAGENTLKRELWTRFEEATTPHGIRFNDAIIHKTSTKGFLDKLEEACD